MFLLKRPEEIFISQFLEAQKDKPFSYFEVGASRSTAPAGYNIDHNRVLLGEGRSLFLKAVEALQHWKMFDIEWLRLCRTDAPIAVDGVVGVLVNHLGFWSLNANRIVYVMEEEGEIEKYGFAYGTLPEHAERGEERFSVEYHHADNQVWYDIYAFSRPNHLLAKMGYPFCRRLQKRFAEESKKAMVRAVNGARI